MEINKYGILLVNKPIGITSHDVVDFARKKLNTKRIGHAGTLDPLAEGLLVLLVGSATRLFAKFVNFDKEYLGELKLGEVTSSGDSQGEVIKRGDISDINEEKIRAAFPFFVGDIEQVPPMVSALRIKGKRLYNLARQGITVDRPARQIKIFSLKILEINIPYVSFHVHCSKGTYVRQLAEDIGEKIGCGAHITKIKRLKIGPFKLDDAVELNNIDESHLQKITL